MPPDSQQYLGSSAQVDKRRLIVRGIFLMKISIEMKQNESLFLKNELPLCFLYLFSFPLTILTKILFLQLFATCCYHPSPKQTL